MTSVCFVTNEIYPLNKGGIGRLLYNIAVENSHAARPAELHFLMVWQPLAVQAEVRGAFDGLAQVHFCPLSGLPHGGWIAAYERSNALKWHFGHAYRQSLMLYAALRDCEAALGRVFDYIEFPDFGGWALASLEAKAAGFAFADSQIVVRLHSTGGVIDAHQPFYEKAGHWTGAVQDMEYLSLRKADVVIGHLAEVVDYNCAHYGFPQEWADAVLLETPPLGLTAEERQSPEGGSARGARDFIFSSRLQPFKQPDLFIKAALYFLDANPTYEGRFRLISYGWDERYINGLERLIPAARADRVMVETDVTPADRLAAIRGGIVVIPSNYESLCLFAFEASLLSGRVILNRACLAFAPESPWQDGVNCLKFDGTAPGLAAVMAHALETELPETVTINTTAPYWVQHRPRPVAGDDRPALAVLLHGFEALDQVQPVLDAARAHAREGDSLHLMLPSAWRTGFAVPDGVMLHWHAGARPWPEDIAGFFCGRTGLVALWDASATAAEGYLDRAARAMGRNSALAAYGAHARLASDTSDTSDAVRIYSGDAPSAAVLAADVLPPVAVFRASVVTSLAARGAVLTSAENDFWFEALARTMALEGLEMTVEPAASVTLASDLLRAAPAPARDTTLLNRRIVSAMGARPPFMPGLALKELPRLPVGAPMLDLSHALRGAVQEHPALDGGDWQPVAYRMKERMLLVHPMPDITVAARLPVLSADVSGMVGVRLRHFGEGNPGVDFRLRVVGHEVPASSWQTIMPGETQELVLEGLEGVAFDGVLVEARPSDGHTTDFGWTFVDRLWTQ